jgi:hypothetical protein
MVADDARAAELQAPPGRRAAGRRAAHVARGLAMRRVPVRPSRPRARSVEVQARAERSWPPAPAIRWSPRHRASAGIAAAGAGARRAGPASGLAALPALERDDDARPAAALVRSWLVAPLWYLGDFGRLFDHVAGMSMHAGEPLLAAAARTGLANAAHPRCGDLDGARRGDRVAGEAPARTAPTGSAGPRPHRSVWRRPGAAWQQVSAGWRELGRTRALRIQRLRVEAHHTCAPAAGPRRRLRPRRPPRRRRERDTAEIERERMPWSTALAPAARGHPPPARRDRGCPRLGAPPSRPRAQPDVLGRRTPPGGRAGGFAGTEHGVIGPTAPTSGWPGPEWPIRPG